MSLYGRVTAAICAAFMPSQKLSFHLTSSARRQKAQTSKQCQTSLLCCVSAKSTTNDLFDFAMFIRFVDSSRPFQTACNSLHLAPALRMFFLGKHSVFLVMQCQGIFLSAMMSRWKYFKYFSFTPANNVTSLKRDETRSSDRRAQSPTPRTIVEKHGIFRCFPWTGVGVLMLFLDTSLRVWKRNLVSLSMCTRLKKKTPSLEAFPRRQRRERDDNNTTLKTLWK